MTNAEKFLKDENYKKTLWYDFKKWCNDTKINCPYGIAFEEFMDSPVKPQLTEDERVILRNIDTTKFNKIGVYDDTLMLFSPDELHEELYFLKRGLFQFIKERRRILNRGVAKVNTKFRDRYIKAQIALRELLECDKTISHIDVFITKERNVIIAFDLMGSTIENEKLVTKVKDFVPDFALENCTEEKN